MAKKEATVDDRTVTKDELKQVDRANDSGKQPVVFVHGLWLLPSSWDRWARLFEGAGYSAVRPGLARRSRHRRGGEGPSRGLRPQVGRSDRGPLRGGDPQARTQAGGDRPQLRRAPDRDLGRPRPVGRFRGHLPGAVPRRAAAPDLRAAVGVAGAEEPGEPPSSRAAHVRAVPLRLRQRARRDGSRSRCTRSSRYPGPGEPIFQAAAANLNPWTEAKVDSKNPDRGPMLIISGDLDHTVPPSIAKASYKKEQRNPGETELGGDAGPRPLAHDRPRLARGRRYRARRSSSATSERRQIDEGVGELVAQHAPKQLAGLVERELGRRVAMRSGVRAERSTLRTWSRSSSSVGRGAGLEHDGGDDPLAPLDVGDADDGGRLDRRVLDEHLPRSRRATGSRRRGRSRRRGGRARTGSPRRRGGRRRGC